MTIDKDIFEGVFTECTQNPKWAAVTIITLQNDVAKLKEDIKYRKRKHKECYDKLMKALNYEEHDFLAQNITMLEVDKLKGK